MTGFEFPFFVTPHAIDRFREMFGEQLSRERVIDAIQSEAQRRLRVFDVERISEMLLHGTFQNRKFYIVVTKGEGEWPSVATVLGIDSVLHGNMCKGLAVAVNVPRRFFTVEYKALTTVSDT